ncbi:MAG: hypothetical protein FJX66_01935 [Alphaproteobacteria bacterium]|nr:hypothetical protein [Alphaproteobacteria bacterium]
MNRRDFLLTGTAVALFALAGPARASAPRLATLYKDPLCGCCTDYGHYLEANGFAVTVIADADAMVAKKAEFRVPAALEGCHSTVIESYIVEGHVPIAAIDKLLTERPNFRGLSLPGMPMGSPGMNGEKEGPFEVVVITDEPVAPVFGSY